MRCRNCHTGMMESDLYCPGCRAPADRAMAAAPGAIPEKPSGLWLALPIFGGALGGLLYAGLVSSGESAAAGGARGARQSGGWGTFKWVLGVFLLLAGGLFLVLAFVHFDATLEIARREPETATAVDLRRKAYVEAPPGWIAYRFTESKPIDGTVTRHRLGRAGEVQARCLLVRVDHRWLVATVAPGFQGNNLVGRIVPTDSQSSQSLIERVRKQESQPSAVLPYEFNAVEGCASDQQVRYTSAGIIGGLGLGGFVLGLLLCFSGSRR
jgi:hypothetical protein